MVGFLYYFFLPFLGREALTIAGGDDTGVPSESGFIIRILSSFLVLLSIFCPKQKRKRSLALDVSPGSGETEKQQSARKIKAAHGDSVKLFTVTTRIAALCSFRILGQHPPVGFFLVPWMQ